MPENQVVYTNRFRPVIVRESLELGIASFPSMSYNKWGKPLSKREVDFAGGWIDSVHSGERCGRGGVLDMRGIVLFDGWMGRRPSR